VGLLNASIAYNARGAVAKLRQSLLAGGSG